MTAAPISTNAEPSATLLYAYDAATAFELSVQASDVVRVVEPEDDAGWIKVRTSDGRVGLVPASYLQLGGDAGPAATVAHSVPQSASPQKTGKVIRPADCLSV